MKSKKKKVVTSGKVRLTVLLPKELREAMNVVSAQVRVLPSFQTELGIREYLKQHEELLKSHGITI